MTDTRTLRKARQNLRTDKLLGMDFIPRRPSRPRTEVETPATEAPPPVFTPPPLPRSNMNKDQKIAALAELQQQVARFVESSWPRDGWNRVVFGEGDPDARLMFIGEGPGAEEDIQGRPFVGRAGELLDKQIAAMGLERSSVYIANIAKTRPPGNRVPTPEEAERWMPWLEKQIEIISPKAIVALGATSSKYLLRDPALAITKQRGQWKSFRGIDLMLTFHPAYLLRQYTTENRRRVWDDLKKVLDKLGLKPPAKAKGEIPNS